MATLLEGLKSQQVSKQHKAFVKEQQNGWLKCQKPNNDVYGLLTNQFVERVDKGEIVVENEDKDNGIIFFVYKSTGSPFK
jgi:hypothetical protein